MIVDIELLLFVNDKWCHNTIVTIWRSYQDHCSQRQLAPGVLSGSVISQDSMDLEAVKDRCMMCRQPVKEDEAHEVERACEDSEYSWPARMS